MKVLVTDFFDVWMNMEGWEVNNQCRTVYNTRYKLDSRKSCLKFLKSIDYLKKSVREASIYWEYMDNGYILYQAKDLMPICSVEFGEIVDKYYWYNQMAGLVFDWIMDGSASHLSPIFFLHFTQSIFPFHSHKIVYHNFKKYFCNSICVIQKV